MSERDWSLYYARVESTPRETLLDAAARFDAPGRAVDLACGAGRDTLELLRRGWSVLAVDSHPEGIARLRAAAGDNARLEMLLAPMEDAQWGTVDLINASFALPFCPRDRWEELWARIRGSLAPGGRFAGQLFGPDDEWADECVVQTRAEAETLLAGLEVERFDEVEEDRAIVTGAMKHWHLFHCVAREPD